MKCHVFLGRDAAHNSVFLFLETTHPGNAPSEKRKLPTQKGGLAQLVERLLCKQNVNGSNPLTSTTRLGIEY